MNTDLYKRFKVYRHPGGDKALYRRGSLVIPFKNDDFHIVKQGETLLDISFTKYNTDKLWWLIADANLIFNPFDELTIGSRLRIPNKDLT